MQNIDPYFLLIMEKPIYEKLARLREDLVKEHIDAIQELLLKYYDSHTQIMITKDYWRVIE